MPLPRESKTVMPTERTTGDVAIDFARAGAQGVSFGFADESCKGCSQSNK